MIDRVLAKVFGTQHERDIKKLLPRVRRINALEPAMKALSDDALRGKTAEFRARIAAAMEKVADADEKEQKAARAAILDEILEEAFAVVREASVRALGMRPFDVQLIGGMVLHQGKISEMKTGEGKTLVATMPVYLNALPGRGVHVVTVNDYLARRDADWMGRVYRFLGLTVGCIQNSLLDDERQAAYACDVTYGTNNEFGFDYLRDNMKFEIEAMVQRGHVYAIVDEVDSILIDEARTPLIISGPSEENTDIYYKCNRVIPSLVKGKEETDKHGNKTTTGDYLVDEKSRTAVLTEEGVAKAEKLIRVDNLYDVKNIDLLHGIEQALRAHALYKRDVDYMIRDGQVLIVDEFTGRVLPGRRWSDGLHQAVEAKENVKIERENQTLATITLQNYFRLYEKLAGMTGTADTEASEFHQIYKLDVVVIPTNQPMIRADHQDVVYASEREKYEAVADDRAAAREGQPGPRRDRLDREVRAALEPAEGPQGSARRLERQVPREGGRDRRAGRPPRLRHDRDEHGRPRHGHRPRRQPGGHGGAAAQPARQRGRVPDAPDDPPCGGKGQGEGPRGRRALHRRHGATRVAPRRQPAARPQRPPGRSGRVAVLPVARRRPDADLRVRPAPEHHAQARHGGGRPDRARDGEPRDRARSEAGRRAQLRDRKHLLEYDDVMNRQREEIYTLRRDILQANKARDPRLAETILDSIASAGTSTRRRAPTSGT